MQGTDVLVVDAGERQGRTLGTLVCNDDDQVGRGSRVSALTAGKEHREDDFTLTVSSVSAVSDRMTEHRGNKRKKEPPSYTGIHKL